MVIAEGQNVYLWNNSDDTYEYIPAIGGAGGLAVKGQVNGINGEGLNRATVVVALVLQ